MTCAYQISLDASIPADSSYSVSDATTLCNTFHQKMSWYMYITGSCDLQGCTEIDRIPDNNSNP